MTRPRARLRSALAACALALLAAAPAPLRSQEGARAVQDVTLADVALPLGGTLFRAPTLTASGTRLSREDLAAILRPDASEPWPARLARLDAGSLSAPVLVAEHAGPGDARQTVTYRDVVARDVRGGRVGELTAAGAVLAVAGGASPGDGTYGRLRATDLDLAALSRLGTEAGDGPATGPVLRVYGALEVADIAYADARGATVRIAGLAGTDLGGRRVPGGWAKALDAVTAGPAGPGGRRAFAAAAADLIEARSLGGLELRGLSVSDLDPHGPLLFEVGRAAFAPGPGTSAVLEGLALTGAVRARLARLELTDLSLAQTVAGLRALAAAPDPAPGLPLTRDELRRLQPTAWGLALSGLAVDLPPDGMPPGTSVITVRPTPRAGDAKSSDAKSSDARPSDAKPSDRGSAGPKAVDPKAAAAGSVAASPRDPLAAAPGARVALREARLASGPPASTLVPGAPGDVRFTLSGLTLPTALLADVPALGALRAYGYDDLDLDAAASLSLDPAQRAAVLRDLTVSGRGLGSVRLAGALGGVGGLFDGAAPDAAGLMASATARTLDLTVEDGGLFGRFLAAQARDLSLKPDELRREYVTASLLGVPLILGNTPAARAIGAALAAFVAKPGRLVLRARAKDPAGIPLSDLGAARAPGAVLDRLDVDAKAE